MGISTLAVVPSTPLQTLRRAAISVPFQVLCQQRQNGQTRSFKWTSEAVIYSLRKQMRHRAKMGGIFEELENKTLSDVLRLNCCRDREDKHGSRRSGLRPRKWDSWIFESHDWASEPKNGKQQPVDKGFDGGIPSTQAHYKSSVPEGEIDPITNRRVVKNPSIRPDKASKDDNEIPVKTFKGYRSQFHPYRPQFQDFIPPETFSRSREPESSSKGTVNSVEEGLKSYDEKAHYESHQQYDPAQTTIDYSDPVQEGLKTFDEKIAGMPLESCSEEKLTTSQKYDDSVQINDSDKQLSRMHLDPVQEAIRDYEAHEEHPEITQEIRDQCLDAGRRMNLSREAFEERASQSSQTDPLLESIQEYQTSPPAIARNDSTNSDPVQDGLKAYDCKANYEPKHILDSPIKAKKLPAQCAEDIEPTSQRRYNKVEWRYDSRTSQAQELEKDFESLQGLSAAEEAAAIAKVKGTPKLHEDLRIEHSELLNHVAHARGRIDAKIAEVEEGWGKPQETKKMTGNFVRDFPEEFETSWSQTENGSGTLIPQQMSERQIEIDIQSGEQAYVNKLSTEAFARDPTTTRLETALDRTVVRETESDDRGASKSSPRPNLLDKTSDKKIVRAVRQIYEDRYGTIDSQHRQVPNEKSGAPKESELAPEPTLYKILAYDPTMQSISTAETTSIVADSASPLTPAEVLLRLSNPAKFFPHFEPLQSQGFEIVSGSGDVLVFRKVRSGFPPVVKMEKDSDAEDRMANRIRNPIDGMSCPRPTTGNFASPTGFVNHDIYPDGDKPPFVSNIDVRREEPVFSGKKNWNDEKEDRPRSRGKRVLIGAAWVAACSYAIGVVADFFKTGGIDGVGPQGF